jgi:hypothetical protein
VEVDLLILLTDKLALFHLMLPPCSRVSGKDKEGTRNQKTTIAMILGNHADL